MNKDKQSNSSATIGGSSWSWLYDSWIYNYMYMCYQCLSPLKL